MGEDGLTVWLNGVLVLERDQPRPLVEREDCCALQLKPGERVGTVAVTQDDIYTLARIPGENNEHVLDLRLSPGTEAYAFTFG